VPCGSRATAGPARPGPAGNPGRCADPSTGNRDRSAEPSTGMPGRSAEPAGGLPAGGSRVPRGSCVPRRTSGGPASKPSMSKMSWKRVRPPKTACEDMRDSPGTRRESHRAVNRRIERTGAASEPLLSAQRPCRPRLSGTSGGMSGRLTPAPAFPGTSAEHDVGSCCEQKRESDDEDRPGLPSERDEWQPIGRGHGRLQSRRLWTRADLGPFYRVPPISWTPEAD
jgi:hypothetical protein